MAQEVTFGGAAGNPFTTAARWIKVWVGIVVIAFVLTCLFLVAIISALNAIDRSLAVTTPTVGTIRGATDPLPRHVELINGALSTIDANLKAIPGQADTIIASLTSIDGKVANVNSSLASTSSTLTTALGGLKTEDSILQQADVAGADNRGVKVIIAQANIANGILTAANSDTSKIDVDLSRANGAAKHVQNICRSAGLLGSAGRCS